MDDVIEDAELVEDEQPSTDLVVIPLDEKVRDMIEQTELLLRVRNQIEIHPWVRLGSVVETLVEIVAGEEGEAREKIVAGEEGEAREKFDLAANIRYLNEIQQIVRDVNQRQLTAGVTNDQPPA